MAHPFRRLRILLSSRHGLALLGRTWAVQFGLLSGAAQLYLTFWPDSPLPRGPGLLAITGLTLLSAILRSLPRNRISREFSHPDFTVTVEVGDLFEHRSHLVVGFSDTFDTDVSGDLLVARRSVQGQLLTRVYGGDTAVLDTALDAALAQVTPVGTEARADKPDGKLVRYPLGTVAVLSESGRRIFCSAYGRMGNDLVVNSGTEQLWHSLTRIWDAHHVHGQRGPTAMPIVGSDLARINSMDRGSLLKLILLSFVSRSRDGVVSSALTIVVHPRDYYRIDMLELDVFLRAL
ncbi:macro domain-containing protein [Streptacidiphilus sp. N1-12]|uniref:Macro domain-containing protein n=2 Tax=Streptacidiphilus alkalitolerans TaxID=3342712 RepID=A0ABV6V7A0_9ACTN